MPKIRKLSSLTTRERAQFILNNGMKVKPILDPYSMKMRWQAFCGKHEIGSSYTDEHTCLTENLSILRNQAGEGFEQTIIK